MTSINRWILRRQRKLLLVGSTLFVVLIIYVLMYHEDIPIDEKHFQPFSERCISSASAQLIQSVCQNFSKGLIFGDLCQPLCTYKSISISECIHHGSTYVLVGKSHDQNIVIKQKTVHNLGGVQKYFEDFAEQASSIKEVRKHFLEYAAGEISSTHGVDHRNLFYRNIERISKHIFGKNISLLSVQEMKSSWQLVGQDELITLALHQNLKSFPKLKGTCGPVYAMEYIRPYSELFPEVIPTLSWFRRVKIARSFIKLIEEFESTELGPLFHCDVQEGNFGLTKTLEVKAIDVDLIYSTIRMNEILEQPQCNTNDQCDFFDCFSQCNVTTKTCTTNHITNNLQIICRDIFLPQWPNSGLLSNLQPRHISNKLNSLLRDCASSSFGMFSMDHSNAINMVKELRKVLDQSLQHNL